MAVKDPAIWSRQFALSIGKILAPSGSTGDQEVASEVTGKLLQEMTEDLRYLPVALWRRIERFSQFLVRDLSPPENRLELLQEVRAYVAFLRSARGLQKPADEDDDWSDEDRLESQAAAHRRLEAVDQYTWPGARDDARAG